MPIMTRKMRKDAGHPDLPARYPVDVPKISARTPPPRHPRGRGAPQDAVAPHFIQQRRLIAALLHHVDRVAALLLRHVDLDAARPRRPAHDRVRDAPRHPAAAAHARRDVDVHARGREHPHEYAAPGAAADVPHRVGEAAVAGRDGDERDAGLAVSGLRVLFRRHDPGNAAVLQSIDSCWSWTAPQFPSGFPAAMIFLGGGIHGVNFVF
ncbi:hypothetical protein B0H10DRAFT_1955538 [Mycena sp. CBHHK59/15]|nr:hypothetical protein B0H10DRAFT_1955538 [Mycena sp. CBHHK59/15]